MLNIRCYYDRGNIIVNLVITLSLINSLDIIVVENYTFIQNNNYHKSRDYQLEEKNGSICFYFLIPGQLSIKPYIPSTKPYLIKSLYKTQ